MKMRKPLLGCLVSIIVIAVFQAAPAQGGESSDITRFAGLRSLLEPGERSLPRSIEGLKPCLQEGWGWEEEEDEKGDKDEGSGESSGEGWGWGEEEKKDEGSGESSGDGWGWGEEEGGAESPPSGEGGEDSGWGEGWEEGEGWQETGPADVPVEAQEEDAPSPARREWVQDTRIGIEFGAFLPFGAKKEAFDTGELGGVFLGFGLPPIIEPISITNELRVLGGYTLSEEQDTGYDVTTILFLLKDDLLFHFFPQGRSLDIYVFVGLSFALESSSASRTLGTETEEESGTFPGFLVDAGFGAWITLSGPVDLLLRLEFDLVPMSDNVPFFAVGQAGIQVRF